MFVGLFESKTRQLVRAWETSLMTAGSWFTRCTFTLHHALMHDLINLLRRRPSSLVFVRCCWRCTNDEPQEDDEGGVSAMREAFEEALTRVGVHLVLGGAVWRSFLRFETEELEDAEEMGVGDGEISKAQDR